MRVWNQDLFVARQRLIFSAIVDPQATIVTQASYMDEVLPAITCYFDVAQFMGPPTVRSLERAINKTK